MRQMTSISRGLLLAFALALAATSPAAQEPDPSTAAAVDRAGRYVVDYLEVFSALVCEEHQIQTLADRSFSEITTPTNP